MGIIGTFDLVPCTVCSNCLAFMPDIDSGLVSGYGRLEVSGFFF